MSQQKIIRTNKELKELQEYLIDKEYISFDTETTGLKEDSEIIGFSICADVEVGYYVILSYWDITQQKMLYLETKNEAPKFLSTLVKKKLVMHNGIFDCSMVHNYFKVSLIGSLFHDTMISGHLLNENRSNGLKERASELYGEDSRKEQALMKESVSKNGGMLTRDNYELYKADADLIAKYGCQDAILTLKLFYEDVESLFNESLDKFFYEDESMPLLKGPTYEMNTTGLRVNNDALLKLRGELETECLEAKAFIYSEIDKYIKEKYPNTNKSNQFNIGSSKQLSWLLYIKLGNEFNTLTEGGRELCKVLQLKLPYSPGAKKEFIRIVTEYKDHIYAPAAYNYKTKKMSRPKKVGEPWNYIACGKESLNKLKSKYKWVEKLLEYSKALKILNTYVIGIQTRMRYNIIHPSFLQHGTTSGRYSSRNPNFQNLPRDDKRVKSCIIARPGCVFVGADYAQLEPRVFASISNDETLIECFKSGKDFYSVIGAPIFDRNDCSVIKSDKNSFAKKFPALRDKAKVIALATPYGRTAAQQAMTMGISIDESKELIEKYFDAYPKVELMMLESHEQAKENGKVFNLYGRPRRMPEALNIEKRYGSTPHCELPYDVRNILNLAMNHRVQSTAASIMNRAAIHCWKACQKASWHAPEIWAKVKIIMQVHDELILEGPEEIAAPLALILKDSMENAIKLPNVALVAEPKIGKTLAEIKDE